MKKSISFLLILVMSLGMLTGCGSKDVELTFTEFQTMRSFGNVTPEVIEDLKKEEGVKEVTHNEDGSTTIIMEKEAHDKLVKSMKEEMEQIVEYTETASDFGFIKSIETNEDYSLIEIFVDKGELEVYKKKNKEQGGEEILEALSLSLGSIFSTYKAYAVKGEEVELKYIDEKSKEEVQTVMFPEHFKKMMEEAK